MGCGWENRIKIPLRGREGILLEVCLTFRWKGREEVFKPPKSSLSSPEACCVSSFPPPYSEPTFKLSGTGNKQPAIEALVLGFHLMETCHRRRRRALFYFWSGFLMTDPLVHGKVVKYRRYVAEQDPLYSMALAMLYLWLRWHFHSKPLLPVVVQLFPKNCHWS